MPKYEVTTQHGIKRTGLGKKSQSGPAFGKSTRIPARITHPLNPKSSVLTLVVNVGTYLQEPTLGGSFCL